MNRYLQYLKEIKERKINGLNEKPIDDKHLLEEIINIIQEKNNIHRKDAIHFFIYNVLPGTTSAASIKSNFLKKIILQEIIIEEISPNFAFELLSHMKGGPSIKVLLENLNLIFISVNTFFIQVASFAKFGVIIVSFSKLLCNTIIM